jgi:hypothetical protein
MKQSKCNRFETQYGSDITTVFTEEGDSFIIDTSDIRKVKNLYWAIKEGYVRNRATNQYLHNYLLDRKASQVKVVDHINKNTLDNRKVNLRVVSHSVNMFNSYNSIKNTSGFKGVSKHSCGWRAYITLDYTRINLGTFKTREEAYKTRLEKENKIMKSLLEVEQNE